jgi:hypothetical protein
MALYPGRRCDLDYGLKARGGLGNSDSTAASGALSPEAAAILHSVCAMAAQAASCPSR